jgi:hypothetical protein
MTMPAYAYELISLDLFIFLPLMCTPATLPNTNMNVKVKDRKAELGMLERNVPLIDQPRRVSF